MGIKEKLKIEEARICYKNFSGKKTDYNEEGKRNFCVVFDDETTEQLRNDGWPVRTRGPREGYDDEGNFNTMKVNIAQYKDDPGRDPKIYRICNGHKVLLTAKNVGCLDFDDIIKIDLVVRPYNWERANRSGTSAYLDVMYVTVEGDPFAGKYETVEDDFTDPEDAPY